MLDLQPRVHLEKVKRAVGIEQELDGPRVGIADRRGDRGGGRRHAAAQLRRDRQRRALFDDLLVTPLDRTFAFDKRQHGAVMIGQQLHFDVPRRQDAPLQIHRAVAERRLRFGARGAQRRWQVLGARDRPHALAAAAGHGLQHQRIADARGRLHHVGIRRLIADRLLGAGHHRHAGGDRRLARRRLAAHHGDGLGRRADEDQPGVAARGRELFVLGQEPVAGMHRVGAGLPCDLDDGVDAQVALARRAGADRPRFVGQAHVQGRAVAVGIDRHRSDPHVAARADHTDRDLAAVGDQDLLHQPNRLRFYQLAAGAGAGGVI